MRKGSIQKTFLPLRHVTGNGIVCYAGSQPRSYQYRVVLEVTGVNFNLLSEQEQQSIFEGYQRYLAGVAFPTQLLVRVSKLNLHSYLQYLAPVESASEETWAKLATDHTAFLETLMQDRMLLERRFYLVVPADDLAIERSFFLRSRQKQEEMTLDQAEQQLKLRCELVALALQQLGLHIRQLDYDELVRLLDAYLGTQRFPLLDEAREGLARGQTRLEDIVAPASLRVEPDCLVLEEQEYLSALVVRALPRMVSPGFLQPIVMLDQPMDIVFHQFPKQQNESLSFLRRKQTQYESSKLYLQEKGRIRPEMNLVTRDIAPLIERVAGGQEQLHDFAFHLLVRAPSKDELQRRVRRASETLYAVTLHRPQVMYFEQEKGFRQGLPGGFLMSDAFLLDSSAIASAFPFFSNLVYRPSDTALLEGITVQQEPVVSDWWGELTNANRFLLAPSGKGKSFKAKMDIERLYMMYQAKAHREEVAGETFQIFVIDPEREYQRLCEELGGQWIRFSPGSDHHINPFDLPPSGINQRQEAGATEKENVLANQVQKLHLLLDMMLSYRSPDNPDATLSIEEKALLDIALYEVYRRVGVTSNRETHDRQVPLLRDLYHVLESGEIGEDATSLARRLRRFVSGSLSGLFADVTNVQLDNPLIIFDVKDLDDELRPITLLMISNLVWNRAFASVIPRFLFIDELATFYRYRSGARFAEEMFQRARKQYLSITGITQHPHLFKESAIIANCATHILLGQDHTTVGLIADLFQLSPREAQLLRTLKRGEALMLVDGKRMQVSFQASQLEYQLATTNPRELAEWEQQRQERGKIQQLEAMTGESVSALALAGQELGVHQKE
jgi:hypothetical protein